MTAQTATGPTTTIGIEPLGSYTNDLDQLNLADLGLHIDIPLYVHPTQRGGGRGVAAHLIYDSSYFDLDLYPGALSNQTPVATNVGWRIEAGTPSDGTLTVQSEEVIDCRGGGGGGACGDREYIYGFVDSTGYTHQFPWLYVLSGQRPSGTETALDGSGYLLTLNTAPPTVVTAPSGVTNLSGGGIAEEVDANGNITYLPTTGADINSYYGLYANNYPPQTFTDTSNVSIQLSGGGYSPAYPAAPTSRNPVYLTYTDTTGNTQQIVITYKMYTILPDSFQTTTSSPYFNPNQRYLAGLVDSVTYPDGSAYHFTYQSSSFVPGVPDGQLASMQLPVGGTITYQNTWTGQSCQNPLATLTGGMATEALLAGVARTTPDGTTTYTRTVNSSVPENEACPTSTTSTTNISHPDGSSETIQFVGIPEVFTSYPIETPPPPVYHNIETAHSWYDGSTTPMKSTMKCYNGASGNCATSTFSLPITQIATTTTLDSGQTSKTVESLNGMNLPTEVDEYDYGASSPTRKTITQYASLSNNISDHPSSVVVQDASGNIASNTTFGYDEYTLASANGAALSPISGSRGNQTSVHRWLNAISSIDTHSKYDAAGQKVWTQDGNGNWTQYTYDSAADSCIITTTPPTPSSGVSQATSATCDPNTGLLASATDANGVKATYSYDSMLRPTGAVIKTAAGAVAASATRSYSGSSLPEIIKTTITASPSPNEVSSITLDGLGRTVTAIAPSGAETDTVYNSMGYVQSVSNPYLNTTDSTYGITTYSYDGLGRKLFECTPDNGNNTPCAAGISYLQWSYSGNVTTSYDELRNSWQSTNDALGRLMNVVEPNGATTGYTYDVLNNLLSVNQLGNGTTDTPRTRSFTYDSLSRMITAKNPETGTICYGELSGNSCIGGYDANGNLLWKTDANGTELRYTYDALNRLSTRTGPPEDYQMSVLEYGYDQGTNGIGRLTSESTYNFLATSYVYDPMGRVSSKIFTYNAYNSYYPGPGVGSQTPPGWNRNTGDNVPGLYTNSTATVGVQYDLAGNPTQITYPDGRVISQVFDGAGRLETATDATPAGTSTTYFTGGVSGSQAYTASGALENFTLGNGVTQTNQYNDRLQPCRTWASTPALPANTTGANGNLIDRKIFYSTTNDFVPASVSPDLPRPPAPPTNCGNERSNTGSIRSIVDNLQADNTQSFSYDNLNRLTTAIQSGGEYNHTYNYDSFGNMILQDNLHTNPAWTIDPATNRLLLGSDYQYNAAGQLIAVPSHTLAYTAGGNLFAIDNIQTGSYFYDANNERALAVHNNSTWDKYVYLNGQVIADLDNTGNWTDYVYANGQKIAKVLSSSTNYYLHDHLGTTRIELSSSGAILWQGQFTPFGQEIIGGTTTAPTIGPEPSDGTSMRYKFTGEERDVESGLDYVGARYYASSMGRFSSPDPGWLLAADLSNPQSLNMYSYVLNNPLINVDPTGMECVWDDGSYDAADDKQTGNAAGCSDQGGTYVDPNLFENAMLTNGKNANIQYGSWSGQANSTIASSWTTVSATAYGGANAAQMEVNDAVSSFLGNGPKSIEYAPNDPFTLSFQSSAGMDAINAKITANCSAMSGKVAVGSGEAFVNTLIDGVAGGQGFHTPEAQLGAFNATYSRDGFTVSATVTNPISLNSASYHATSAVGIKNPSSGLLGTVHQTVHIIEPDPCNGHT